MLLTYKGIGNLAREKKKNNFCRKLPIILMVSMSDCRLKGLCCFEQTAIIIWSYWQMQMIPYRSSTIGHSAVKYLNISIKSFLRINLPCCTSPNSCFSVNWGSLLRLLLLVLQDTTIENRVARVMPGWLFQFDRESIL